MMDHSDSYPSYRFRNVDNNLLCAICHRVPFPFAAIGRCQHVCCKSCITERMRRLQSCPTCQEKLLVHELVSPGRIIQDLYRNLEVTCEFNERGCHGWFRLGELATHQSTCVKAPVRCSNEGCCMTVNRENLEEHERKKCEYRIVSCDLCSMKVKPSAMKEHKENACLETEYKCTCGQKIRRGEKESHLATSCRDRITVPCPVAGCRVKVAQGDIESHIASSITLHIQCLMGSMREQEKSYQEEFNRLRISNESLTKQVGELRSMVHHLQIANQDLAWYGMGAWIVEADGRNIWNLGNMGQRLKEASLKKQAGNNALAKSTEPGTPGNSSVTSSSYVPFLFWSPLFLTHTNGYRFSLRLDLGTYPIVGLFLHIHESDHDEILEWPFNLDYIVQIGNVKITTTQREAHSHYLKQGKPPHELSWGWNHFCNIDILKEAIFQDTLTVSICFYAGTMTSPTNSTPSGIPKALPNSAPHYGFSSYGTTSSFVPDSSYKMGNSFGYSSAVGSAPNHYSS